ncbi:MAG: SRPBCC domain-containing protein [bacterium]|nr:SRPBCC domain-containing protein [bacterium]
MSALDKMQVEILDRTIVFTRMFDAPRQLVWDAWTKKEHLEKWWGPHHFTNKDCSISLKKDGKMLVTMVGPDGGEYPCEFVYNEIMPIEKIVWTDVVHDGEFWGPDGPPPSSVLTMLFDDLGNKTKMTMTSKFETNEGRDKIVAMGAAQGWAESLERLDDLLKN